MARRKKHGERPGRDAAPDSATVAAAGPREGAPPCAGRDRPARPAGPEPAASVWEGPWLVPLSVGLVVGVAYVATACRAPYWDDSTELILACREPGVAHPTGYPLYTQLGHLLSLAAPGPLPFRIVLLSALPAALGVALACRVMRVLGASPVAAASAALALGFSRELWDQSTLQEVYGMHICILAGLHLAILSAWARPGERSLGRLALLCGLALTHHMKSAFTVLAVGVGALASPRVRSRLLTARPLRLLLLGLLPLTLYGALPLRSAQGIVMDNGHIDSLAALLAHVRGSQFAYRMFTLPPGEVPADEVGKLLSFLGEQAGARWAAGLLALPVALGLWALARGPMAGLGIVAVGVLIDLIFTLGYNIPDKDAYFIPVVLALAYALAAGLDRALQWIESLRPLPGPEVSPGSPGPARVSGTPAAGLLLLLLPLLPLAGNLERVDRSHDTTGLDYPADLMAETPPGSLVVTDDLGLSMLLLYRRVALGLDEGKAVVCTYLLRLPWYLGTLARLYPDLSWPQGSREALIEGVARLGASGVDVGEESQRLVDRLTTDLMGENLARRPVCLSLHDIGTERSTWGPFFLQNQGLIYRLLAQKAPPVAWSGRYADPSRYCVAALPPGRRSWVARRYSTSLNRLGIVLIGLGRLTDAREAFQRALLYEPRYAQVLVNLGVLYSNHLHQPDDAYRCYQEALSILPSMDEAENIRAWCRRYEETRQGGRPAKF